jgi:peptidoglycan-associated lipoprotein
MVRSFALALALGTLALASGCAKKPAARSPESLDVTAARVPRANVHVDDELIVACKIQFNDVGRAPKFDFDDDALLPEDRAVLEQIAKCITTGPLAGRSIRLVGRADSRGETEYNLALGEQRADNVKDYLAALGVEGAKMDETSRGEMDASGSDEDGFRRDRRVDVLLLKKATTDAVGQNP